MQASSPLSSALEKLTNFVLTSHQRPADEPWLGHAVDAWFAGGERAVADWEQSSFSGYLAHGHADEHGERMIDRFLRAPRNGLSADERASLTVVRTRAFVSLFEIVEVRLDVGLELLDRVSGEQLFVREKLGTRGAAEAGWEAADAFADATHLGSHVLAMMNHAIHGKKTFWVDESLAWMLAETDLDIIGRCLRLPFPACAFMFTDRGTLEIAESLLSQETECSMRGRTLRILSVYVARERPVAEDGPQVLNVTFLFDAQGDKWPYLVSRELFVQPDEHLDGILDSHHPSVSSETRDPIFLAPELKKLVHLVINAILYATSAHLEPILLSSKLRRLEQSLTGKGSASASPSSVSSPGCAARARARMCSTCLGTSTSPRSNGCASCPRPRAAGR